MPTIAEQLILKNLLDRAEAAVANKTQKISRATADFASVLNDYAAVQTIIDNNPGLLTAEQIAEFAAMKAQLRTDLTNLFDALLAQLPE